MTAIYVYCINDKQVFLFNIFKNFLLHISVQNVYLFEIWSFVSYDFTFANIVYTLKCRLVAHGL